jgi:hypothetical protein
MGLDGQAVEDVAKRPEFAVKVMDQRPVRVPSIMIEDLMTRAHTVAAVPGRNPFTRTDVEPHVEQGYVDLREIAEMLVRPAMEYAWGATENHPRVLVLLLDKSAPRPGDDDVDSDDEEDGEGGGEKKTPELVKKRKSMDEPEEKDDNDVEMAPLLGEGVPMANIKRIEMLARDNTKRAIPYAVDAWIDENGVHLPGLNRAADDGEWVLPRLMATRRMRGEFYRLLSRCISTFNFGPHATVILDMDDSRKAHPQMIASYQVVSDMTLEPLTIAEGDLLAVHWVHRMRALWPGNDIVIVTKDGDSMAILAFHCPSRCPQTGDWLGNVWWQRHDDFWMLTSELADRLQQADIDAANTGHRVALGRAGFVFACMLCECDFWPKPLVMPLCNFETIMNVALRHPHIAETAPLDYTAFALFVRLVLCQWILLKYTDIERATNVVDDAESYLRSGAIEHAEANQLLTDLRALFLSPRALFWNVDRTIAFEFVRDAFLYWETAGVRDISDERFKAVKRLCKRLRKSKALLKAQKKGGAVAAAAAKGKRKAPVHKGTRLLGPPVVDVVAAADRSSSSNKGASNLRDIILLRNAQAQSRVEANFSLGNVSQPFVDVLGSGGARPLPPPPPKKKKRQPARRLLPTPISLAPPPEMRVVQEEGGFERLLCVAQRPEVCF